MEPGGTRGGTREPGTEPGTEPGDGGNPGGTRTEPGQNPDGTGTQPEPGTVSANPDWEARGESKPNVFPPGQDKIEPRAGRDVDTNFNFL
jgi:hypothetical protein